MTKTLVAMLLSFTLVIAARADDDLVAHWKLDGDSQDAVGDHHGTAHAVEFTKYKRSGTAAGFDGRSSRIEVADRPTLHLGQGPFTIALRVTTAAELDDVLGDLVSKFDPEKRIGFNLGIHTRAGVTSSQANYRQLQFGIDAGQIDAKWTDCGRPGNNLCIFALCVHDGQLFAGTFEHGKDEAGHVYRYEGDKQWVDCGSPDRSNAVQSLAVYNGQLYAGTGRYLARGSSLPESPNETPGGNVYRYQNDGKWIDCGKLKNDETGESFTVGGMAVFRGRLYAGASKPPGRGLYRYEEGNRWTYLGNPGHRVTNPVVFNGHMYFCSLDGGDLTRYDGDGKWTTVGKPAGISQTYGFAIYGGQLYTSTWPNGEVFRYDGDKSWISVGRLGKEKEVMGMAVYNGKLYAGTLPLAEVYRFDGGTRWTRTGQLDTTPDVRYRRAWSMAVHQGKLYCGTLPSGHVYSIEAGRSVTYDQPLPHGWLHLAAVRDTDHLRLYLNGKQVAQSAKFSAETFDLTNTQPLRIGQGAHDHFNGKLQDVRLYRRALTDAEVARLVNLP